MTPDQLFAVFLDLFAVIRAQPKRVAGERRQMFGFHIPGNDPGVMTSISLGPVAADAYADALQQIWIASHWGRRGNEERLGDMLRRFLVEMAASEDDERARLRRQCIESLRKELGGDARSFRIITRASVFVGGAEEDVSLAGLRFRGLTSKERARISEEIVRELDHPRAANVMDDDFGHLIGRDAVCDLLVEATDSSGAFVIGQQLVEDRLNILAGVSALLRTPEDVDNDPARHGGPRIAIDLTARIAHSQYARLNAHEVDLSLLSEHRNEPTIALLLGLAEQRHRVHGEDRMLRTLRWYGRARRASDESAAFLYTAIAYEALLTGQQGGVSYGLRLRTAHLLGETMEARRELLSHRDLYEMRSRLAHGNAAMPNLGDVVSFWRLVNRLIIGFVSEGLMTLTESQIEQWFEERILR